MKYMIVLSFLLVLLVLGCDTISPPPPAIEVEINDNTDVTTVTVVYKYHHGRDYPAASFETPEEVEAYKKQVEFLLKRLDEAQVRMNVHEPEIERTKE